MMTFTTATLNDEKLFCRISNYFFDGCTCRKKVNKKMTSSKKYQLITLIRRLSFIMLTIILVLALAVTCRLTSTLVVAGWFCAEYALLFARTFGVRTFMFTWLAIVYLLFTEEKITDTL